MPRAASRLHRRGAENKLRRHCCAELDNNEEAIGNVDSTNAGPRRSSGREGRDRAAAGRVRARYGPGAPESRSSRLAHVEAHTRHLGLQPPDGSEPQERRLLANGLDTSPRSGHSRGHAARLPRRDVLPQSERSRSSDQRGERRSAVGVPALLALGSRRIFSGAVHQSKHRDLRRFDHRHELRRLSLRARRAQRPAAMGDEAIRLSAWRAANVGPDRRKR